MIDDAPERTAAGQRRWQRRTLRLLFCGVAAGPLFATAALLQGALRPDYSPIRHPISSLVIGSAGWIQVLNFLATGLLIVAFAIGARRALKPGRGAFWGPILLAAWGVGLIGAGVFVTDPVGGYPVGTPDVVTEPTAQGSLHDACSMFGFVCLFAAILVLTVRFWSAERAWAIASLASGLGFVVTMQLSTLAYTPESGLTGLGGLFQRLALLIGLGWMTAVALRLQRGHRSTPRKDRRPTRQSLLPAQPDGPS